MYGLLCICDELRAAELRGKMAQGDYQEGYKWGQRDERTASMQTYRDGWKKQYDKGFEDAVTRAVAAVERLYQESWQEWGSIPTGAGVIAAIEGVRE
jgi:hypothetical protein